MARIVILSDIHLSPTHGFFWDNWCVAREFANAAKADAVIVNGDLTINGPDSDIEIAFAATALGKLRTHVLTLPGNHDVGDEPPGQDPDQIIDADRLARWNRSFAADRFTLDAGDWRLVGVNAQLSARAWSGNRHRISGSTSNCVPPDGPSLCSCTNLSSWTVQPTTS